MRQSNRDRHNHEGAALERGVGSGYRGSYYGSDSYQNAPASHRGRGPKGYVRSDERLREIICEHLTDDPDIDASDISIEVENQNVRLTGSIEDRGLKQEVAALIERIGGVKGIDNRLRTMLDDAATIAEETGAARSGDISPGLPER